MTPDELRSRLNAMSEEEFLSFRRRYGGDLKRDGYVDLLVRDRSKESLLCEILGIPTESDRLTNAAVTEVKATEDAALHARRSNEIAAEANDIARHANRISFWSILLSVFSLIVAIAAVIVAAYGS